MGDFESKHIYTYHKQPFMWYHFIDDMFIIWTHGLPELEKFISRLNHAHPTLKFTYSISQTQLSFLDTCHQRWPHFTHWSVCQTHRYTYVSSLWILPSQTLQNWWPIQSTPMSTTYLLQTPWFPQIFYFIMPNEAIRLICWKRNYI